jgi:hypothetical protein
MFLGQVVKMSDDVTVSSLPHPISMFFLGTFAVAIIYMIVEVNRFKRDNEKMKQFMDSINLKLNEIKLDNDSKISDISKKIDSRVDKALLTFKKQNKTQE